MPQDSRIKTDGRFLKESALTEDRLSKIRALDRLAKERGQTLAAMALAWVLRRDEIVSTLIGASKPSQILDNITAIRNIRFSDEELKLIDDIAL